uniref:V-type ATPase subunit n=1 Tax=Candidatus Fimenecus sp. TaxID=3022888 RepID=UPI004029BAF9
MSNELQIFANGRVSVLTTRLFTADKFVRLAECNSLAEAVRLLADGGYGGGVVLANPNDYDNMLRAETERLLAEFKELCVNVAARNFFLAQYDFVNAKVLMKAKYMRTDGVHGCFAEATFAPAKMQADFVDDNYADYPKAMAEGCDAVD